MSIPFTVRGKLIMSKSLYFFIAALCFLCLRHRMAEAKSSICSPPSDCGNGVPIRYPFWVSNNSTQEHCGYPGLGLTCSDYGPPTITLPSNTYYVTDINYDYHRLTLVDMDVVDQTCPRARHNVSLGNFPLSFGYQLNVNLSFYFNCNVYNADLPPQHIVCLTNEGSKQSYVFEAPYEWNLDCEEKVVVAVKEEEISSDNLVSGFGEAMKKGFVLDWRTAMGCAECEDSGELCGHNQINHQMLCFCSDGSIATKSCSKDTLPQSLNQKEDHKDITCSRPYNSENLIICNILQTRVTTKRKRMECRGAWRTKANRPQFSCYYCPDETYDLASPTFASNSSSSIRPFNCAAAGRLALYWFLS